MYIPLVVGVVWVAVLVYFVFEIRRIRKNADKSD